MLSRDHQRRTFVENLSPICLVWSLKPAQSKPSVGSPLRWWYGSMQYTVWIYWLRCVGHMTHTNLFGQVGKPLVMHWGHLKMMVNRPYLPISLNNSTNNPLIHSINPSTGFQINGFSIDQVSKCWARVSFRHGVSWVGVAVDPSYFGYLSSLVRLTETHEINHQSFLRSGAAQFHQTVVQGPWGSQQYHGQRDVQNPFDGRFDHWARVKPDCHCIQLCSSHASCNPLAFVAPPKSEWRNG